MNSSANKTVPKLIPINESSIDDLFIYKHKVEEQIAKDNNTEVKRMKIDEFINDYLHLSNNSFFCADTKESIAFAIIEIDNEKICFHTVSSDKTLKAYTKEMNKAKWDITNLSELSEKSPTDLYNKDLNINFFVINDAMKTN